MRQGYRAGDVVADRYRIAEKLGEGGMGIVFRAHDTQASRDCALKVLHTKATNDGEIARFKREFRATHRLAHPACVRVFDLGNANDGWFFTMEYVQGANFDCLRGRTTVEIVQAALQVLAALDHIHSKQIVHRDIKPQNILVEGGASGRSNVKISDLGIAKVADADDSVRVGELVGSLRYISPEQAVGEQVDPRSDLYSFGIVLYELLAARNPYQLAKGSGPREWLLAHRETTPTPLKDVRPDVPDAVANVVMRLLEKDPAARYPLAAMAHDELARWLVSTEGENALPDLPPLVRSAYLANPRFVGRALERSRLSTFLDRSIANPVTGAPVVCVVEAEAGMGKSRFVGDLLRYAERRDAALVIGTCRSDSGAPYEPIAELLSWFERGRSFSQADTEPRAATQDRTAPLRPGARGPEEETTRPLRAAASPTQPIQVHAPLPGAPEQGNEGAEALEGRLWNFHRRVANELIAAGSDRGFILLIEDAQWADAPTLKLLSFVTKAIVQARSQGMNPKLAIVLTQRPAPDHDALLAFCEHARSLDLLEHIPLSPLDRSAAAMLVASMLGTRATDMLASFTDQLLPNSKGNPLYLTQILHTLMATQQLTRNDDGWDLASVKLDAARLPSTIRDAIGDRAARFSVGTKAALACAAVIGRQFDLKLLQQVLSVDESELLDHLDAGIRSGFIEELEGTEATYRFTHDRFRESIYDRLPTDDKRRLHRQIGEILEAKAQERPEFATSLAYHFRVAGDHQKAFDYSVTAGDHAMRAFGFSQASDDYGHALDLSAVLNQEPGRSLLERHADASLQAGRYEAATRSYTRCLDASAAPLERAEMLLKLAVVEHRRGNTPGGARINEDVLKVLGFNVPGTGWAIVLPLLAMLGRFLRYAVFPPRLGVPTPQVDKSQEIVARICIQLTESFYFMDFLRAGFYLLAASVHSERLGVSRELASASSQAGYVMALWGFHSVGKVFLDRALKCIEIMPSPLEAGWQFTLRGYYATVVGEPWRCIEECSKAQEVYKDCAETHRLRQVLTVKVDGPLSLGQLTESQRLGTQIWHMGEDVQDARSTGWGLGTLGHVQLRRENYPEAIRLLREAIAASRHAGDTAFRLAYTGRLVSALALDGQLDEAVALGLEGTRELHRTFIRHPIVALHGSFLAAAALLLKRDGRVPREVSKAVFWIRLLQWHYADCLKMTRPWFIAGGAAWDVARGEVGKGRSGFEDALADARAREYLGELHDIHLLASRIFDADLPDAPVHAATAGTLLKQMLTS